MIGEEMFPEMSINPPEPRYCLEVIASVYVSSYTYFSPYVEMMFQNGWIFYDEVHEDDVCCLVFSIEDVYGDDKEEIIEHCSREIEKIFGSHLCDIEMDYRSM